MVRGRTRTPQIHNQAHRSEKNWVRQRTRAHRAEPPYHRNRHGVTHAVTHCSDHQPSDGDSRPAAVRPPPGSVRSPGGAAEGKQRSPVRAAKASSCPSTGPPAATTATMPARSTHTAIQRSPRYPHQRDAPQPVARKLLCPTKKDTKAAPHGRNYVRWYPPNCYRPGTVSFKGPRWLHWPLQPVGCTACFP